MAVERAAWPAYQRATEDQFKSRLLCFPEGFWVAEADGAIVGVSTSCLSYYNPDNLGKWTSWNEATNHGYFRNRCDVPHPNALYVASTGIIPQARRQGIFEAFFDKHSEITDRLKLPYSLTGSLLPGYDVHCRNQGEISPYDYVSGVMQGRFLDPLIKKLNLCGYYVPDARHIIFNYYPSAESRHFSVLMVYSSELKETLKCKEDPERPNVS